MSKEGKNCCILMVNLYDLVTVDQALIKTVNLQIKDKSAMQGLDMTQLILTAHKTKCLNGQGNRVFLI